MAGQEGYGQPLVHLKTPSLETIRSIPMKIMIFPILICTLAAFAQEPGSVLASTSLAATVVTGGGARITKADGERMIQERENHLTPTLKRVDFSLNPGAVQGWAFSRKALQTLLDSMKDKSDGAPVFVTLGHTENLDAKGASIAGTWHETVILSETQPFSFLGLSPGDEYFLQHPVIWP
jgi:hypothetical protein